MKKFKIILSNKMFIIVEAVRNPLNSYNKVNLSDPTVYWTNGLLYDEVGGNPIATGDIDIYPNAITIVFEIKTS